MHTINTIADHIDSTTLFPPRKHTYAVIDGASCPDLVDHLNTDQPEYLCLYRGELEPDMVAVAPYLVLLKKDHAFTKWILENRFGQHWGIFVITSANMIEVRKHFRGLTMVESPDGKPIYFRFYDPRVLNDFIPTCNENELNKLFGPIDYYLAEEPENNSITKHLAPENAEFVPGTLKIRQAQMDELGKKQEVKFVNNLANDVRTYFPEQTTTLSQEQLRAQVAQSIEKAKAYQITGKRDVTDFVYLTFAYGLDFDLTDTLKGAKILLQVPNDLDAAAKMDELRRLAGL